eukprot:15271556-Alexandrium_andersonii.AAC.1
MVGQEFVHEVTGEEAERLYAGPTAAPRGSAQGRRISDAIRVFCSTRAATTEVCYSALRRIARVTHACPTCEKVHPAGTDEC